MRHYLDHAATTPMRPSARDAWLDASARLGNPSSLHGSGRAARAILEDARERIAASLGAAPAEVIFTSGGTEADNLAIKGLYWSRRDTSRRLVVSPVEHHACLDPARWLAAEQGATLVELDVDASARVEMEHLARELEGAATALVAIQWVNNEVGTIQPVAEAAASAREWGVPIHADAVQAVGHLPVDFEASGLTTMAVSAHKIGGPVGIGALVARRDAGLTPVLHGGGQERRERSGTVDVAGAAAFAAALDEAVTGQPSESARLAAFGVQIAQAIAHVAPGAIVHGPRTGAPHIVHAMVPGVSSEAMLVGLDLAGVEVSPGAACTAGVVEPSHVVLAMGGSATDALSTVRVSFGWDSTQDDADAAARGLTDVITRLLSQARSRA